MRDILEKSRIKILLAGYFIDDIRIICQCFPLCLRWLLVHRESLKLEEKLEGLDRRTHAAKVLLYLFNGIPPYLQFTV